MLKICSACLRTDQKLETAEDTLTNLFDELCDFIVFTDASSKFCTVCIYMLTKIIEFKKQCKLASHTLKKWKKKNQNDREPLDCLIRKMPQTRLSFCNKKNIKVYYYQAFQLHTPVTLELTSSKYPHIVTVNLPCTESLDNTLKLENALNTSTNPDENSETAVFVKEEAQETIDNVTGTTIMHEIRVENVSISNNKRDDKIGRLSKYVLSENNGDISDVNDLELNVNENDNSIKSDDDSNDDDLTLKSLAQKKNLTRKKKKSDGKFTKIDLSEAVDTDSEDDTVANKSERISINQLRKKLRPRFISCGELKDAQGDLINTDIILNNLNKMTLSVLRRLKNQVAKGYGPPVLTPESIELLTRLHAKYSTKDSKPHLKNIEQVLVCKDDDDLSENGGNYDNNAESNDVTNDNTLSNDNFVECDDDIVKTDNEFSGGEVITETTAQKKNVTAKRKSIAKAAKVDDSEASEVDDNSKIRTVTERERRQKISKEELRKRLVKAFSNCGQLKDEDGTLIDKDLILNSLDDMALRTLRRLKNQLALQYGKRVLTRNGITLLSQLQKKFSNEYSSGFTVEHLPTRERMLEEFAKRQYYEKYITADHKCELCYTTYRCNTDLENHIKNCHNEKNKYACKVCNVRLSKESSLHWHLHKHRTVFKCKLCTFVSYQKGTMITHYNQHKGVIYTCAICSAQFKSRSGHYMHMNKYHEAKHSCKVCGKAFVSENGLKFHHSKKHQGQDTSKPGVYHKSTKKQYYKKFFTCPVCNTRQPGVIAMRQHMKEDHPSESFDTYYSTNNQHLCHVCGKAYQSATALNEHKNLHTGARPYTCDICGATFAKKGTLKSHVATHMPPTNECKVCGKKFRGATNLMNHMLYHKPPSKECQMCGKMFSTGSNLYNHMKRHLGDRRYKCEICSKTFLDTSARNEHVRGVHNNIRRVRNKRT